MKKYLSDFLIRVSSVCLSKINILSSGTYLDRSGIVELPCCFDQNFKKNFHDPKTTIFHFQLNFPTQENRIFFSNQVFLKEKQPFFHFQHHPLSSLPIGFLEPKNSSNFPFPRNLCFSGISKSQTNYFFRENIFFSTSIIIPPIFRDVTLKSTSSLATDRPTTPATDWPTT